MTKRARTWDSPLSSVESRKGCDSPLFFVNTPEQQDEVRSSTSEDVSSGNSIFPSQCAYFSYLVVYVTDVTYRSSFLRWVGGWTFFPLGGVGVTVIDRTEQTLTELAMSVIQLRCSECVKKWEGGEAILKGTDWDRDIEEMVCGA